MDSENTTALYDWSPPQFALSKPPEPKVTLGLQDDPKFPHNFSRAAKWSPDGSTFLVQCENRTFELFSPSCGQTFDKAVSKIFPQSAPILDFAWYPTASPHDPASFCFISSVRECPVKLIDASDGRLRASYRIVDHRERQVAPHSLAFNPSAQKLYCGFEDAIEVFDVSLPGEGIRLPTTPSKKSKDGLKGIISAIAFGSSYGDGGFYAVGSLSSTPCNLALYTEEQGPQPVMFICGGPRAGVTQVKFNPVRPHLVYASYRRHAPIYSWDIRGNAQTPFMIYQPDDEDSPVNVGEGSSTIDGSVSTRKERTNQKLQFDIDYAGTRLGVGDHRGNVCLFDLEESDLSAEWGSAADETPANKVKPSLKYPAHNDAVGSVSFNPVSATLLTVSGSRHFENQGDSSSSESETEGREERHNIVKKRREHLQPVTFDSSIKLWAF